MLPGWVTGVKAPLRTVLDTRPLLAFSWFTGFWAAAELEMPRIERALVNAELTRTLRPSH